MRDRVTLADVAKLAGVSKASASMALSDTGRVAETTKKVVRRAAAELGYVPHFAASSLRSQKADTIALVLPHSARHVFSHPIFVELLEGITSVANELDLSVMLSTAKDNRDERSAYTRIVRGRRAAGVIIAAAAVSDPNPVEMVAAQYPLVVVGRSPVDGVTSVGIDDIGGAAMVTSHLVDAHGARRIGHVSGPLTHQSSLDKRGGYIDVLRQAGLTIDPRLSFEGNYEEESGRAAARQLLPELRSGDAVFFANDQMAVGAMEVWAAAGLAVPRDVLVVGYDDHPMASWVQPRLTTVGADYVAVGEMAARQLARLMEGLPVIPHHEFPSQLIVRESCGCAVTRPDSPNAGATGATQIPVDGDN